jgi:hypothetical protein
MVASSVDFEARLGALLDEISGSGDGDGGAHGGDAEARRAAMEQLMDEVEARRVADFEASFESRGSAAGDGAARDRRWVLDGAEALEATGAAVAGIASHVDDVVASLAAAHQLPRLANPYEARRASDDTEACVRCFFFVVVVVSVSCVKGWWEFLVSLT